jgi:predicted metal-dependent hydrolase
MTELLQLGDLQIEIEYKRVKNLRLTVYPPDGRVHVSAPLHTSREFILNFASSKKQWIEKHQAEFRRNVRAANQLQNHEIHYVWGVAHKLELIERKGHPKIVIKDGLMQMYARPDSPVEKRQEILDKWYRRIIGEVVPVLVNKWEPLIGVKIKGIYFRKMKSHWGSCNYTKQTIRLNTELAKKPPECLEYVIVHEMIHILEPSHNRNFYRLMNKHLPSWKIIRKKMNTGEI